jgi:G:T-mismatch repair DNA endonuclease (very short patch repair protein)
LRKKFYVDGFKYRINFWKENIDVAFPKKKLAMFVGGCF